MSGYINTEKYLVGREGGEVAISLSMYADVFPS